jgi:hypothetical protein
MRLVTKDDVNIKDKPIKGIAMPFILPKVAIDSLIVYPAALSLEGIRRVLEKFNNTSNKPETVNGNDTSKIFDNSIKLLLSLLGLFILYV